MDSIPESLRSLDLLKDLSAQDLEHLTRFSTLRRVRAGATVFRQAEPSPYCFGVVQGEITILKESTEKSVAPKVLTVLGPGALFGEQALFADSPRTASAQAKSDSVLVAIRGNHFRDWIAKDKDSGLKLLTGLLQSTLSRLRQTSEELSLVYGIGRILAAEKPIHERLGEAIDCLKNNLGSVDEIVLYRRSPYWEEFERVVDIPSLPDRPAMPVQDEWMANVLAAKGPVILRRSNETRGYAAVALIPLMNHESANQPRIGVLWLASKTHPDAFTSHVLLLLSSVSVQFTEALLQQQRLEDAQAQARLHQSRRSFHL